MDIELNGVHSTYVLSPVPAMKVFKPMPVYLLVLLSISCVFKTSQAIGEPRQKAFPTSLSKLASKADLVAVAQVKDTDYVYTRSFPSEGSAYLKILIGYKHKPEDEEIIEVYDKGLHPNECYFENPTVFEEGRRYLVFFRHNPEDQQTYLGLAEGCALEILVTEDNRYALKYPVTGIDLTDNLEVLATEYNFRDSHALISAEDLTPAMRDEMLGNGSITPYQDEYKYTRGVDLSAVRKLIGAEALKTANNW